MPKMVTKPGKRKCVHFKYRFDVLFRCQTAEMPPISGHSPSSFLITMLAEPRSVLFVDNSMPSGVEPMTTKLGSVGSNDIWTKRFMVAAITQGAGAAGLTVFLVLGQVSFLKPEVSRVMAAGGAGTWLTFGYVMYIMVGVIGVAVSAIFYHYLENMLRRRIHGGAKALAWAHLVLMNVGTVAAMALLMYAGYLGGASMLPENVGGRGFDSGQAHEILVTFVEPISVAILMLVAGVVAGGVGFLATYRSYSQATGETASRGETAAS